MSAGSASRREPVDRAENSAAALLRLIWLASPALPVGGFSYSEGLEAAVEAGLVGDEAQAAAWLTDQLELAQARSDLPLLARAHAAWQAHDVAALARLNDWVRQTRETAELRQQSEQMGRSLTEWLRNDATTDRQRLATLAALAPAPTWPLAFALAGLDCAADGLLLAHAFGWAENMVQAALKAVPLGQSAGQRVLATLARAAPDAVARALHAADVDRQAFAPLLAILSSQHETQYSRLFRS